MMTMKEACEYVKTSRIEKAKKHRLEVTRGDLCSGLTNKEYNRITTPMKKASMKGKTHSHTKVWNYNSSGIHILQN